MATHSTHKNITDVGLLASKQLKPSFDFQKYNIEDVGILMFFVVTTITFYVNMECKILLSYKQDNL